MPPLGYGFRIADARSARFPEDCGPDPRNLARLFNSRFTSTMRFQNLEQNMGEFPCFSSPPAFGLKRQLFDAMADQSPKPRRSVATAPQKATDPLESADCVTDSNQSLLEECLKKAREWEKHCDVNAPEGMEVILLKVLVETVIRLGNPSIIAMCNVRKLLCKNCLEFNATRGQCEGKVLQPMDRCLLLREGNA